MMSTIKSVAVVGASGNIGAPTVTLLHERGFTVTAITRVDSSATFPDYVEVKRVEYTSISDLTNAFTGVDAVVSCLGFYSLDHQPNLVEAAAKAGVKRFIPAEYGPDMLNAKIREVPILASKIALQDTLKRKAQEMGMTYSLIFTGLFLDWGMATGMVVDVKESQAKLYDSGDRIVSLTTTTTVAKAIVGCLQHPEDTKNRGVYVQDMATSQNHIIEIAKQVLPQKQWTLVTVDTAAIEKQAHEALLRQDYANVNGFIFRMYFGGEQYGMPFRSVDNDLFGIKEMGDQELKALIAKITAK